LLLHALVHPADIQDRDGGVLVLKTLFGRYPFLKKLFADGGYQGPVVSGQPITSGLKFQGMSASISDAGQP